MNNLRDMIRGGHPLEEPLLRARSRKLRQAPSRAAEEESFAEVAIRREAVRQANHRSSDRHRLDNEEAVVLHAGRQQTVTLVNLSGGGAMIEGADGLQLWDEIGLQLGGCGELAAAVRWIRGQRLGLEFAQETRIEGQHHEVAKLLKEIIRRSHPHLVADPRGYEAEDHASGSTAKAPAAEGGDVSANGLGARELRHALIWCGQIHYDYETIPVRLRNVSQGGALIECARTLAVGGELLLELDKAGAVFASVKWAHGDTAGLRFHQPFDLQCLASARSLPSPARWLAPDHLRGNSGDSPWQGQAGFGAAIARQALRSFPG